MSAHRIASPYAKALLQLAVDQNQTEAVYKDMKLFQEVSKNKEFYLLVKSPIVKGDKKRKVFQQVFQGELAISSLTEKFLDIVVKKGREALLVELADEFITQYKEHNKISSVMLRSAALLDMATVQRIKEKLIEAKVTYPTIDLQTQVEPALIGGFVVEVGDKLIDASVAHKLDLVKKELSKKYRG